MVLLGRAVPYRPDAETMEALTAAVRRFHKAGIVVSAFIVPAPDQIEACAKAQCDAVELHTGMYANASSERQAGRKLRDLENARDLAWQQGLIVHAGHGLNYRNIGAVAQLEGLEDFNIGHSIVARSIFVGMRQATREMIDLIDRNSCEL